MGQYNSSQTRVWPVFRQLLSSDPTGEKWVPQLLLLAPQNQAFSTRLARHSGTLAPNLLKKRKYGDYELEDCFERSLPPSELFLRWLIQHPEQMTWPNDGKAIFGRKTQLKRERLMGMHGVKLARATRQEALDALEASGVIKSSRKWWAFEGFTQVD